MQVVPRLPDDQRPSPNLPSAAPPLHPPPGALHPAEVQIAASARLLEDLAQTCAVLRYSCLEQAELLRTLTRDPLVLAQLHRAEGHFFAPGSVPAAAGHGIGLRDYAARKEDPYQQQPAAVAHVLDG